MGGKLTELVGAFVASSFSAVVAAVGEKVGAGVWTLDICKSSTTTSL
jgi:hypothetical protein